MKTSQILASSLLATAALCSILPAAALEPGDLILRGGVDVDLSSGWFVFFDVRYMQIETEANNATTGKFNVTLDPWVAGFAVGKTF